MWNPDDVLDSLATPLSHGPWPDGSPLRDVLRSPAAARTGRCAAEQGLFLFHFEHRFSLDLPASWVEEGSEDAAEAPQWDDGRLAERKYQSFRHDLMLGSFHPGHRGKWSTHELCHGLVGFGWRPDAPRLFTATAGRLAELLPVVLYYFLDEIGLTRCPLHAGGGPLFRTFCPACEAVAAARKPSVADRSFARAAGEFLEAELAAVARTRRLGRPVDHRYGSLDLCSDGLAYAAGHQARLNSDAFRRLQPFLVEGGGWSSTLDALEHRVVTVARHLALGEPLADLAPDAAAGRDRWIRQDLAFRLLTVWEQCAGDAASSVLELVDQLMTASFGTVVDGWRALESEFVLPPASAVFGVGYALTPEVGRCASLVEDGLRSVCPLVMELADDACVPLGDFDDPPVRRPLGDRFTEWLTTTHPTLAPLARFETAIRTVKADPLRDRLGLDGSGAVLCEGTRVLVESMDVLSVAEHVEKGSVQARLVDEQLALDPEPTAEDWSMVIGRFEGELVMLEVDPSDGRKLVQGEPVEIAAALQDHGVMRPETYDH